MHAMQYIHALKIDRETNTLRRRQPQFALQIIEAWKNKRLLLLLLLLCCCCWCCFCCCCWCCFCCCCCTHPLLVNFYLAHVGPAPTRPQPYMIALLINITLTLTCYARWWCNGFRVIPRLGLHFFFFFFFWPCCYRLNPPPPPRSVELAIGNESMAISRAYT